MAASGSKIAAAGLVLVLLADIATDAARVLVCGFANGPQAAMVCQNPAGLVATLMQKLMQFAAMTQQRPPAQNYLPPPVLPTTVPQSQSVTPPR